GVSSFSVGGTNCHLVLAPPPATRHPRSRRPRKAALAGPVPLAVSGSTAAAMRAQARRLGSHAAAHPEVSVAHLGPSLATSRSALAHRSIVLASSREDMLAELAALASGERTSAQVSGVAGRRDQPVFVFPAQGSQWPVMAAGLLASSDVFADRIRACAAALGTLVDWSVEDVL